MAGVVLETLSNRKLALFGIAVLLFQIAFYLIGGLICPKPFNVQQITGTFCVDTAAIHKQDDWFWSRGKGKCQTADNIGYDSGLEANQVIFTFQFPTPKSKTELEMTRWHQNMVGVFSLDIQYLKDHPVGKNPVLTLHGRLAARDKHEDVSEWHEIATAHETRELKCIPPKSKKDGHSYECEPVPLFELGSVFYDYYLLNVRLPAFDDDDTNSDIGKIDDLHLVVIHPNGGFIHVWFGMKIALFPIVLAALIWYWVRVLKQSRNPNLLEKNVFALGCAMSFLNLPVEVFSLWVYMPFMMLYSDVREGAFYAVLACFWVIFAGEHLMETVHKNTITAYWKHLTGVLFGCACLFIFELCERGVQLMNPFYSIWGNASSTKLAYTFLVLAGIAGCVYFLLLLVMMIRAWRSINTKKSALPSMPKTRRNYYIGIIYRFKFMIVVTLYCAAMSVAFFVVGQTTEGHMSWDNVPYMEYGSAFLTGVYGMWNLYVLSMLILYAPSHKVITSSVHEDSNDEGEEVEFTTLPTETSAIAEFARKAAAD